MPLAQSSASWNSRNLYFPSFSPVSGMGQKMQNNFVQQEREIMSDTKNADGIGMTPEDKRDMTESAKSWCDAIFDRVNNDLIPQMIKDKANGDESLSRFNVTDGKLSPEQKFGIRRQLVFASQAGRIPPEILEKLDPSNLTILSAFIGEAMRHIPCVMNNDDYARYRDEFLEELKVTIDGAHGRAVMMMLDDIENNGAKA